MWRFEGKLFPAYIDRRKRQRLAKVRRQNGSKSEEERRAHQDPAAMLHAMDVEGLDVVDRKLAVARPILGSDIALHCSSTQTYDKEELLNGFGP